MPARLIAARHYLAAPADHFWTWSDGGVVAIWASGETIAFRPEIYSLLEWLAPHGLPPLDDVLLILAACREAWTRPPFELVWALRLENEDSGEHDTPIVSDWGSSLLERLAALRRLPADLRQSLEAKGAIAEIAFEGRSPLLPSDIAGNVLELLRSGPGPDPSWLRADWKPGPGYVERVSYPLLSGLSRVDESTVRLRMRTGLDQLPLPADEPAETGTGGLRALLDELSLDPELGGMARLARNLMAVVQLPRRLTEPDELPMGGVSDIANRGPLDRLLLSELAHDDLTLAVRVAVNEALYLRRETPPRPPPEQRGLLLDAGIRLWGVPRVFATSVALALAANSESRAPATVWRAARAAVRPVDLASRDGIIAHLEGLETTLHPGDALPAFREELDRLGDSPDAVLITDAESFDDPDFQQALAASGPPRLFVATVARNGEFRLWQWSATTEAAPFQRAGRRKPLREAKLDLAALLERPKTRVTKPLLDPARDPSLPAIFGVHPFPFRLPHRVDAHNTWKAGPAALLALSRDGRLMLWDDRERAARQIAEGLPRGRVAWAAVERDGLLTRFLIVRPAPLPPILQSVHLCEGVGGGDLATRIQLDWKHGTPLHVFHDNQWLALMPQHVLQLHTYRISDGQLVETRTFSPGKDVGLPFVVSSDPSTGESALQRITAGETRTWAMTLPVRVDIPRALQPAGWLAQVVRVFERSGCDGPFAVLRDGQLLSLADGSSRPLSPGLATPVGVVDADPDGSRLLVVGEKEIRGDETHRPLGTGRFLVETDTGRRTVVSSTTPSIAAFDVARMIRSRIVHRRFLSIFSDGSTLVLVSRSGHHWQIAVNGCELTFRSAPGKPASARLVHFVSVAGWARGYDLRVAQWNDGSRAWLDGRGLLHLKSSDRSIPEATLVLAEEGLAAWCSDGRSCGDDYFLCEEPHSDAAAVFQASIGPFAARCLRTDSRGSE